jgi:hypothetical protein
VIDRIQREMSGLAGPQADHDGICEPAIDDLSVELAAGRMLAVDQELDPVEVGDGRIPPAERSPARAHQSLEQR